MSRSNPPEHLEQTPEAAIMGKLAKSCQTQSDAIADLLAKPTFDPLPWMVTALDDLDAALNRLVAVVSQFEERSANGSR